MEFISIFLNSKWRFWFWNGQSFKDNTLKTETLFNKIQIETMNVRVNINPDECIDWYLFQYCYTPTPPHPYGTKKNDDDKRVKTTYIDVIKRLEIIKLTDKRAS